MSVVLEELELRGEVAGWERLGFAPEPDGSLRIGSVRLRFGGVEGGGIAAWTLRGLATRDLDGLPTRAPGGSLDPATPASHPNGALSLDHVVVLTPDLERTFAACEAAGLDLRRVREAGDVRQGFYRLGEPLLEVVGNVGESGPARFGGLVVVVADLDTLAERAGDALGRVKDAVQPGRRIATARESAGLGLPVAFMSPHRGVTSPPQR